LHALNELYYTLRLRGLVNDETVVMKSRPAKNVDRATRNTDPGVEEVFANSAGVAYRILGVTEGFWVRFYALFV
jgi:hypothetical protein